MALVCVPHGQIAGTAPTARDKKRSASVEDCRPASASRLPATAGSTTTTAAHSLGIGAHGDSEGLADNNGESRSHHCTFSTCSCSGICTTRPTDCRNGDARDSTRNCHRARPSGGGREQCRGPGRRGACRESSESGTRQHGRPSDHGDRCRGRTPTSCLPHAHRPTFFLIRRCRHGKAYHLLVGAATTIDHAQRLNYFALKKSAQA
jgi:hypothetical protein